MLWRDLIKGAAVVSASLAFSSRCHRVHIQLPAIFGSPSKTDPWMVKPFGMTADLDFDLKLGYASVAQPL
jgi:hypothetical protein